MIMMIMMMMIINKIVGFKRDAGDFTSSPIFEDTW